MKINNAWGITLASTLTLCLCLPAKAQLSNNLSVGNPGCYLYGECRNGQATGHRCHSF